MARFAIITLNFAPEPSGFAPHAASFARYLAARGHDVSVFTGFPFAPQWKRRPADRGRLFARHRDDGVTVHRITHFIPRRPSSAVQRIAMEGSFAVAAFVPIIASMLSSGRPDAVIYIGAQPALAMLARVVAALARRPYLVRITDLAARAALDVGIVGGRLSRALDTMEFAAYQQAAGAMVLCGTFERALAEHRYPADRIRVIANPIDIQTIRPVPRQSGFRSRHGISDHAFVILHSGSMGLKQGLLTVIGAAALVRDTSIRWVFVGDGEVREALVAATRAGDLDEMVRFLPFQPERDMSAMFAAADVLLVNQIRAVKDTLIPGKLLTYLAAGRPVLVAANPESQAAQLLRAATGGLLAAPDDSAALADAARRLAATDPRTLASFGASNRAYAEAHFDQQKVLAEQEEFLLRRIS